MTGTARSDAELDYRRRKIRFRAWHRGMREVDLILGSFADAEIAVLDESELDLFEALMNEPDADIYKWLIGEEAVPTRHDTLLFARILGHRAAAMDKQEG